MKKLLSIFLSLSVLPGWASDTIFQSPPDLRLWDTAFMIEVFVDHFDGDSLNTSIWLTDDCKGRGNILTNNEGGPGNIEVSNGTLKLTARYDPGDRDTTCWAGSFTSNYTTAEIYSIKNRYLYGSFEALCRMPEGRGMFFAWWLWGKGDDMGFPQDQWASEIDVAENINNNMIHAFHYWPPKGPETAIDRGVKRQRKTTGKWHLYKVIWTPFMVEFYVDGEKTWEKSKFYTGRDSRRNNVPAQQIRPGILYRTREWFPRHGCATIFQMQLNNDIAGREQEFLPATMMVDYVKVKQYFRAPEIACPDTVVSSAVAVLDVDPRASGIAWQVTPAEYFPRTAQGSGTTAIISPSGDRKGKGRIVWTFRIPSGETFSTGKDFWVEAP